MGEGHTAIASDQEILAACPVQVNGNESAKIVAQDNKNTQNQSNL
jgi:hypothetical protein